ncbi:LANO_0H19196g1_1 [Lachancea nothofagi CBS 11611]|uniref:LANO_0H19196g1_1 n=1 Tax=Lachancea nothofagi CBS 11611 TaxID=1266666 RepID=A0A1G4KNG3_9SACH|nr:LANO_0H19196g1_1 [Lachancea nothofagi CBS 11611]
MHHALVKIFPTFHGYVDSTTDVLLILQAVLDGELTAVSRRPYEIERSQLIASGNVFVFIEEISGIRRWTDGMSWSPSRILGKFLVYREQEKHKSSQSSAALMNPRPVSPSSAAACPLRTGGLIKKSMSLHLYDALHQQRQTVHLISYYTKYDCDSGKLKSPSSDPFFGSIRPCPQLIDALDSTTVGGGSRNNNVSHNLNGITGLCKREEDASQMLPPASPFSYSQPCLPKLLQHSASWPVHFHTDRADSNSLANSQGTSRFQFSTEGTPLSYYHSYDNIPPLASHKSGANSVFGPMERPPPPAMKAGGPIYLPPPVQSIYLSISPAAPYEDHVMPHAFLNYQHCQEQQPRMQLCDGAQSPNPYQKHSFLPLQAKPASCLGVELPPVAHITGQLRMDQYPIG